MKKPNEILEQTSLSDLMPGFDKQAEWLKVRQQLHPATPAQWWRKAVAVAAILVATGSCAWWLQNEIQNEQELALAPTSQHNWAREMATQMPAASVPESVPRDRIEVTRIASATLIEHREKGGKQNLPEQMKREGEFVCNSTPCPVEICITQNLQCPNQDPAAIKSCSVVDPDQARQLKIGVPAHTVRNCRMSVSEISIERIATGEMIVLNEKTRPATAQELFNCITSDADCSLMAGMFTTDCDKKKKPGNLRIQKDAGSLILE